LVALALSLLAGCSPGLSESAQLSGLNPGAAQIEYRFNDSSVPPEYHRSYTVSARSGQASIVVDSYGDIVHEETAANDVETWLGLVSQDADLDVAATGDPDECAGGTSRELQINQHDDTPLLDIQVAVCGDEGQAEAARIEEFVEPLLQLFDLETLLAPSA